MLNPEARLIQNPFDPKVDKKSTRDGFGAGVIAAGKENKNIVVLSADLKESTRAESFEKEFPGRFIEMGIAEQGMATLAAGLALAGKIPFITSYAAFSPGRNYEQIRTTIALNDRHVVVCGMHAGVSVGPDGATHQMLEDIGMMRMLPNMTVIVPGDAEEARKATTAAAAFGKPVYLRFGRSNVPVFTTSDTPFAIGKALRLWRSDKPKVALMATGSMSCNALMAARALEAEGIGTIVLHVPTVKPLDEEVVLAVAKEVLSIVTVEEHQIMGGFGSAIAEYLSEVHPIRIERLGVQDQFGQSGEPDELIEHYGLGVSSVQDAVRRATGTLH
ncbi:MAG: transketolase C-terminal domain-containing protein [bacterium]